MSSHFGSDLKNTFKYMGLTIISPYKGFKSLIEDERQHVYAFYTYLIMNLAGICVCLLGAFFTTIEPARPFIVRFVGLTDERLYIHFAVLFVPVLILMYLSAYAVIEMGGMFTHSQDNFKQTFSTSTYGLTMPMWLAIIGNLIIVIVGMIQGFSEFPGWAKILCEIIFYVMVVWTLVLVIMAALIAKNMKGWKAFITGLLTTAIWWAIMLFFVL